jgi:hypothetical protein
LNPSILDSIIGGLHYEEILILYREMHLDGNFEDSIGVQQDKQAEQLKIWAPV